MVGTSDLAPMSVSQTKVRSVAASRALRRSFGIRIRLKAAQLNTNNQSTFASPRSFTFFRDKSGTDGTDPIFLSHKGDWRLRRIGGRLGAAASAARREQAQGGLFESRDEFRRSQGTSGMGELAERGQLSAGFSGG